jgi:sec-independent protein translocase protein TatA
MLGNLTGWHLLIIVAIVLLLFGATRLPALARSIGQSTKIFREEMKSDTPASESPSAAGAATPSASATVAPAVAAAPVINPPATVAPIAESAAPKKSAKSGKSGKSAKS